MRHIQLPSETIQCGRKTLLLAFFLVTATFALGFLFDTLPGAWAAFVRHWKLWAIECPAPLFWASWTTAIAAMAFSAWGFCCAEKLSDKPEIDGWFILFGFLGAVAWVLAFVATGYAFEDLSDLSAYMLAAWLVLFAPFPAVGTLLITRGVEDSRGYSVFVFIFIVVICCALYALF